MEDRVVLDENIGTAVGRSVGLVVTTLHAETIVAGINDAIDDEAYIHVREVNGITILGVPRTAYSDAVNDDIL